MTVENVNKVETIGEPLVFTIKKDETLVPEKNFPEHVVIELSEIHVGGDEGIIIPDGRRFVPSFDKSKAKDEQILAWSNKEEKAEGHEGVFVKGMFHVPTCCLTINGEGFETVVVKVYEYVPSQPVSE